MLIAVTGATGFIGRHLVRDIHRLGHRCRAWYRPKSDRSGFPDGIEWVPGELGDVVACRELVRGADALVHAATAWNYQQPDMEKTVKLDVLGSVQLFGAARAVGVRRAVFLSSCLVYEGWRCEQELDENLAASPSGLYGACKAAVEGYVQFLGQGENWAVSALRLAGVYGIAHPVSQSPFFSLVREVLEGKTVDTYDFFPAVHVEDVIRAVQLLVFQAENADITGKLFNCFDGYLRIQDVARLVKELTGSSAEIIPHEIPPQPVFRTDRLLKLGMKFRGEELLRQTLGVLVQKLQSGHGGVP